MNREMGVLKECIDLIPYIYDFALSDEFDKIGDQYHILVSKLSEFINNMDGEREKIVAIILSQVEELYSAVEVGDSIKVIDIAEFEMKPMLRKYLESIGE